MNVLAGSSRERTPLNRTTVILAMGLAGAIIGGLVPGFRTSSYLSAVDLLPLSWSQQNEPANADLARSYAVLAHSPELSEAVARRLTDISPGQVQAHLAVQVPQDSQLLRITTTAGDPDSARLLAQTVAEEMVLRVHALRTGVSTDDLKAAESSLRVVAPASQPTAPQPVDRTGWFLFGLVLGLLAGLGWTRLGTRASSWGTARHVAQPDPAEFADSPALEAPVAPGWGTNLPAGVEPSTTGGWPQQAPPVMAIRDDPYPDTALDHTLTDLITGDLGTHSELTPEPDPVPTPVPTPVRTPAAGLGIARIAQNQRHSTTVDGADLDADLEPGLAILPDRGTASRQPAPATVRLARPTEPSRASQSWDPVTSDALVADPFAALRSAPQRAQAPAPRTRRAARQRIAEEQRAESSTWFDRFTQGATPSAGVSYPVPDIDLSEAAGQPWAATEAVDVIDLSSAKPRRMRVVTPRGANAAEHSGESPRLG